MELWNTITTRIVIWQALAALDGSKGAEDREKAILRLIEVGEESLPFLYPILKSNDLPLKQYAAAVILHRMGIPDGLTFLVDCLKWRLRSDLTLASDLIEAFVKVGAPDAVTALLELWRLMDFEGTISINGDGDTVLVAICRVFALLRDPRALDALTAKATRIPRLYLQTVPQFGEVAVTHLQPLLRSPDPAVRRITLQALRLIASGRSFSTLAPMLRDPEPDIRSLVPDALEATGGPLSASQAIVRELQNGFSSREAVETLDRLHRGYFTEQYLDLIARWNPQSPTRTGDTPGAVAAALDALRYSDWASDRLYPTVCALLERKPEPEVCYSAARMFAARFTTQEATGDLARESLLPLLAHLQANVREEAAQALFNLGDPLGRRMVILLESCRPQGSLMGKLRTVLQGGTDAGQAANQAVAHVSNWLTRVSLDTTAALRSTRSETASSGKQEDETPLITMLINLLRNALNRLAQSGSLQQRMQGEETVESLQLMTAAVTALGQIGTSRGTMARNELLRSLHISFPAAESLEAQQEASAQLRQAAAETLTRIYGQTAFPLLLQALYSPSPEVSGSVVRALGGLGEARALPHLQSIASNKSHPYRERAEEAILILKKKNPEMLTLLRPSTAIDHQPATLLRPVANNPDTAPEELLRASSGQPEKPSAT